MFNFYKCLRSTNETRKTPSKYPLSFCYSMDNSNAYGICIPFGCENDANEIFEEFRIFTNGKKSPSLMENIVCVASRRKMALFGKIMFIATIILDISLVFIILTATITHFKYSKNKKTLSIRFLFAFSLKQNWHRISSAATKNNNSTITCLWGLRFLAMLWVIVGHSFLMAQYFIGNIEEYKNELVDNFWNMWIANFTLSVDVFFLLSGTLVAYNWMVKWKKNVSKKEPSWTSFYYWLTFYRHRLVRIWPPYIYMLFVINFRYSASHYQPGWPLTDPSVQCPKYWWHNLIFVNSLTGNYCLPWTWYIGTEFIFYFISPIFLLTLRKNETYGFFLSVSIISISNLLNLLTTYKHNFPPTQFPWRQPEIFNQNYNMHNQLLYIRPEYRIGPYIIGLLLGDYLAKIQNSRINIKRSNTFIINGWALAILGGFWTIYGPYTALQGWNFPIYHYFYGTVFRMVFALSLSWLIYACHTGIGGPVNDFLSLRIFLSLSSISYSVYLFHMLPVVFTYMIARKFPIIFSSIWLIIGHIQIQTFFSYILGSICAFGIELPVINIEQIFLKMDPKKKATALLTEES